jgi:hypothetical protein
MPDAAEAARPMHSGCLRIAQNGCSLSRTERSYGAATMRAQNAQ